MSIPPPPPDDPGPSVAGATADGPAVPSAVPVVGITERDWRQVRELRLLALADTPLAFVETLTAALTQTEQDWRARARRSEGPQQRGFAAVIDGRWVGTMRVILEDGHALLQSVFVLRSFRGRALGVADALLDAVENWVRAQGLTELFLDVHEDNARAQALYRRRGFTFTGERSPYPLDPAASELRMSRGL